MCGRYSLGVQRGEIHRVPGWRYHPREWRGENDFHPRHNVAPRSNGVVMRRLNDADESEEVEAGDSAEASDSSSSVILQTMRWGLVPHYSKHEDKSLSTTNARAENLVHGTSGIWLSIKNKKRCVVLCEGYYEWLSRGKEKFPYFTRPQNGARLMLLAGMYDCAILEGDTQPLWSFTIVTCDANKDFSWLHDRQPVILPNEDAVNTWLDCSSDTWTRELSELIMPYRDTAPLECYQVPKEVGRVGTESATFIEPVADRQDGIKAMFAKQSSVKSSPAKTNAKRSRSPSGSQETIASMSPLKKPKFEKVDAWEDDNKIEYLGDNIEQPASPKKVDHSLDTKLTPASPKAGKKAKSKLNKESTPKGTLDRFLVPKAR